MIAGGAAVTIAGCAPTIDRRNTGSGGRPLRRPSRFFGARGDVVTARVSDAKSRAVRGRRPRLACGVGALRAKGLTGYIRPMGSPWCARTFGTPEKRTRGAAETALFENPKAHDSAKYRAELL